MGTVKKFAVKLMSDPRVMKLMSDPRVMRAAMRAFQLRGELNSAVAKRFNLATRGEVDQLRRTIQDLHLDVHRLARGEDLVLGG
jgi:hypothetical protein